MVIVLMGVSGSGKSTVGRQVAERLGSEFHEGDDHHSEENRARMRRGQPLSDSDREPWLTALRELIASIQSRGANAIVSCSALKQSYRERLQLPGVHFVYLKVSPELLQARLASRRDHFFDARLLGSQLDILEEPQDAITVDAGRPIEEVVNDVLKRGTEWLSRS